jgi:hypothetical protein
MTLAPQFWARVRGMTSSATPTAAYGHCSTPAHVQQPRDAAMGRQNEESLNRVYPGCRRVYNTAQCGVLPQ